jgi:hypothetical protein
MNALLVRTVYVVAAAATAFNLGRLSVEFSGTRSAWVALIACVVVFFTSVGAMIYEFWGSKVEKT